MNLYTCSHWSRTPSGWQCRKMVVEAERIEHAMVQASWELRVPIEEVNAGYISTVYNTMEHDGRRFNGAPGDGGGKVKDSAAAGCGGGCGRKMMQWSLSPFDGEAI